MESFYEFMINLGFDTKVLHNIKHNKKICLLSEYYGCGKAPVLHKKYAKIFLNEFMMLEIKNKEVFQLLFRMIMARQFLISGPPEEIDEHKLVISNLPGKTFYKSSEWQKIRYKALKVMGNKCNACGSSPSTGAVIHVDHILPRSLYPEYALVYKNLQILCEACNKAKSNTDFTDWRK